MSMAPARKKTSKHTPQGPPRQGNGPSFLAVAKVRRPFGVKGELLLKILTDFPKRLMQQERLYVGEEKTFYGVESIRRHGREWLLRLEGIADRDAAERLRGGILYSRLDDLPPLPEGVYYLHQIEGLEVLTEAGENLGTVREVLKTGANDVYVVKGDSGEILLPAIPQVIRAVRLAEGRMIVRMMEGL
jgi:16S rRNA processing protein RimM